MLDCNCGGRMINIENKVLPPNTMRNGYSFPYTTYYTDYSDPRFNKMQCNKCGARKNWKRRQPRLKG